MIGNPEDLYLLGASAGYGFIAQLSDLYTKNKAGKAVFSLSKGAQMLPPVMVINKKTDQVALATREGHLLIYPISGLPLLAKGKGIKLIDIPSARLTKSEECMVASAVLTQGQALTVYSGARHLTLKAADLKHYTGARGRRGNKLPKGFQRVERLVGS